MCLLYLLYQQVGALPQVPPGKLLKQRHFTFSNSTDTIQLFITGCRAMTHSEGIKRWHKASFYFLQLMILLGLRASQQVHGFRCGLKKRNTLGTLQGPTLRIYLPMQGNRFDPCPKAPGCLCSTARVKDPATRSLPNSNEEQPLLTATRKTLSNNKDP